MHVVVIRRAFYEHHSHAAGLSLRCARALKKHCPDEDAVSGTLRYMLPWMIAEIEEIDNVFAGDPFVNGIEPNRPTIDALINYLLAESMLASPVRPDDLFIAV